MISSSPATNRLKSSKLTFEPAYSNCNFACKDTYVTIDDLRGDKQIKAKAQKKVKKILELSSSKSDIDTSENSYISDSSSAACSEDVKGSNYKKNIKNVNNQK
jgi:hypothetical protein